MMEPYTSVRISCGIGPPEDRSGFTAFGRRFEKGQLPILERGDFCSLVAEPNPWAAVKKFRQAGEPFLFIELLDDSGASMFPAGGMPPEACPDPPRVKALTLEETVAQAVVAGILAARKTEGGA